MQNAHGVQQWYGEPAHGHLADNWLALNPAMADDHEQRNAVEHIQRGQSIDAVSQARVLHEQCRPSAPHPGTGAYSYALLLASYWQVDDLRVAADQS